MVASLDASVRKFGKALEESPVKLSRKGKREAVLHNNSDVTPADGYKIIDASILQSILNCISKCYNCGTENKLLLQQNNKKRNGLCEMLILHCTSCNTDIKSFKTSQQTVNNKMADINLRSVLATTAVGGGLSTLRKLCTNFNLSQPVNEHPYNNYIKFIEGNSIKNCERSMLAAAKHLRALKYGDIDDDVIVDVPVSVDGSWQKRYGHNSMLGMIFVMSIDTGHVLDYSV